MKQTVCHDIPELVGSILCQGALVYKNFLTSFWINVIEVVHDELSAGCEVSSVELIGNIPAKRTKLATFLEDGVQECNSVEHGGPGKVVGVVQRVLGDVSVRPLQAGSDPLGWLVRVLQSHLQQTDRESLVDLCCHPQPEKAHSKY